MCVIANVQSLVSLPDSENTSALLQTEGEENMHVENSNEHGTEQPAKGDLNVENTNEHGTEQPAKEDLNCKVIRVEYTYNRIQVRPVYNKQR